MRPRRSSLRWLGVLTLTSGLAAMPLTAAPRPPSAPSAEADALAERMLQAVDAEAWEATRVLAWNFRGDRSHLWDRDRSRVRVLWKRWEVQLDLLSSGPDRDGVVLRDGRVFEGDKRRELLDDAYGFWVNDSFWLNPVVKIFDAGTQRSRVTLDEPVFEGAETTALLVEYSSGGLTPGDAYLWHLDADARPVGWQMWVSNIPVGGAKATWENWTELSTGAWVARGHDLRLGAVDLSDVAGFATLADWQREFSDDVAPFAELEAVADRP